MLRRVLPAILVLSWAGAAEAQQRLEPLEPWVRQVHEQLWAYRGLLDLTDLSHEVVTGSLAEGEVETVKAVLQGGASYTILGVCDNDCADLDLRLRSRNGNVLDADIETDDFPLVQATVAGDGSITFDLEVIMASCSVEPCRYGVAVFER